MGDAHQQDVLVQQVACHALELIAFGSPDGRAAAITDGAVEAELKIIKTHRKSTDVLLSALAALQALIDDQDCQRQMQKLGGVGSIVAALGDNREDPQIQYWGKLLLQGVANANTELRTEIVRKCHFQGIDLGIQ